MFERFTDRGRAAIVAAQEEARRFRHGYLGTEHLLLGVVRQGSSSGGQILARLGFDLQTGRHDLERIVGIGPDIAAIDREREEAEALRSIGIDIDEVRRRIEDAFGVGALDRFETFDRAGRAGWLRRRKRGNCRYSQREFVYAGHMPFTPRAKKVIELSLRESRGLGHSYVGTEHIILGLVAEGEGVAVMMLRAQRVEPHRLRSAIVDELSGGGNDLGSRPGA